MKAVAVPGNEEPAKKAKLHKQEIQKRVWMITYASGCSDISAEILHAHGIMCDECYTITWRESKYTLIHLKTQDKMRLGAMTKAISKMEASVGLKLSSIVGYEGLTSNQRDESSVCEHPGFRRMIQLLNQNPDDLAAWSAAGDWKTNRKGLLWKFMEETDLRQRTRAQLISQILEWAPTIQEAVSLRAENETLRITLDVREKEIRELEASNTRMCQQLVSKIEECTALKVSQIRDGHYDPVNP